MKTIMTTIATVATVTSGAAFATQTGSANPYAVQPHELSVLNTEPSAKDIAAICVNMADYRELAGDARNQFLTSCEQDI